ncbi:MAG: hypothetical protein HWQ38_07670 [Nostoc sp. NMS7]|nr:hypothetical protein [Nostoc sp. NMS7]MBN3946365.1 hypothetical protein [Nostoc sp. NMS7]
MLYKISIIFSAIAFYPKGDRAIAFFLIGISMTRPRSQRRDKSPSLQ